MFSTIVIGFDDSPQAHDAVALALALADPASELVAVLVHPRGPGARVAPVEPPQLAGRARARTVARPATSAAAGLAAAVDETGADLVVVGSSRRGPIGRVLPGTTGAQMLHATAAAVAVAPAGLRDRGPVALREIGVGFDGGDESRRALAAAVRLAAEHEAALRAIAVIEPVGETFGWAGAWMYPEYRDDAVADARDALAAAVRASDAEALGVTVAEEVVDGMPAEELLRASERLDLLVLGSRGYGPLGRILLGSVATRVAGAAACPLLVWPRAEG
ncbi:MAG TPA: universal stress protein [Capillimicrobium sp.]|nr:universal stress protein [Capillimicrobium sp.]